MHFVKWLCASPCHTGCCAAALRRMVRTSCKTPNAHELKRAAAQVPAGLGLRGAGEGCDKRAPGRTALLRAADARLPGARSTCSTPCSHAMQRPVRAPCVLTHLVWRLATQPLKDTLPGAYVTVLGTPDYLPGVRVLVRGQLRHRVALPALTRSCDARLTRCGRTARRIR